MAASALSPQRTGGRKGSGRGQQNPALRGSRHPPDHHLNRHVPHGLCRFDTETNSFWRSQQSLSIPAELKAYHLDDSQTGIYLFFFNEVLSRYSCYFLHLTINEKDEEMAEA